MGKNLHINSAPSNSKTEVTLILGHDGISHAAIDMVCALMEPMHEDYDLRQEQYNKQSLLSSERFLDGLLDMWTTHVVSLIFIDFIRNIAGYRACHMTNLLRISPINLMLADQSQSRIQNPAFLIGQPKLNLWR